MSWRCTDCGGSTRVLEGGLREDGIYRRRRECRRCGARHSTGELLLSALTLEHEAELDQAMDVDGAPRSS